MHNVFLNQTISDIKSMILSRLGGFADVIRMLWELGNVENIRHRFFIQIEIETTPLMNYGRSYEVEIADSNCYLSNIQIKTHPVDLHSPSINARKTRKRTISKRNERNKEYVTSPSPHPKMDHPRHLIVNE